MKYDDHFKLIEPKNRKKRVFIWFLAVFMLSLILVGTFGDRLAALEGRSQFTPLPESELLLVQRRCRRSDTGDPRGPFDSDIPYIISPRRTLLLNDRPKLIWNAVPGVTNYTVSLQKRDEKIWETTVNGNEIVYPGTPPLEQGVEYLLAVKASNGRSSDEEKDQNEKAVPDRGFRLLPPAEAQIVKTAIEQLNNQSILDETKALLSAYVYIGAELKSEAIEQLKSLTKPGVTDPKTYRKLGELYQRSQVAILAQTNYNEAIKKATAIGDIQEKARSQEELGKMYEAIGDDREAISLLTEARDSYQTLGNTQRVKELEEQIKELNSTS